VAARNAHKASASSPVSSGKGASQGAKLPLVTAPKRISTRPEASAPTTMPSSTGDSTLAMEKASP
jgi:hypothetical protein